MDSAHTAQHNTAHTEDSQHSSALHSIQYNTIPSKPSSVSLDKTSSLLHATHPSSLLPLTLPFALPDPVCSRRRPVLARPITSSHVLSRPIRFSHLPLVHLMLALPSSSLPFSQPSYTPIVNLSSTEVRILPFLASTARKRPF
ncbi:hypothetical protein ACMFMG_003603 [Clarireedia jacksonii]